MQQLFDEFENARNIPGAIAQLVASKATRHVREPFPPIYFLGQPDKPTTTVATAKKR